ncbi:MAG: hypothetical protein AAFQ79_04630 [Pseudomonadota bacterium]
MSRLRRALYAAIWAVSLAPLTAHAVSIQQACLIAGRTTDPKVCACIQAAANRTLSTRDQRLAVTFFSDPDRAQEVRRSDRRRDERFWERYRSFGETAETFCRS